MGTLSHDASLPEIRVFLLVENRLLRETLVRLFRKRPDLLVVGQSSEQGLPTAEVGNSECDLLIVAPFHPNQVPMLALLAGMQDLGIKTVLIGMDADEEQFLASVRAGALGYLLKDASAADVVAAVRAVYRGEAVCPSKFCATLFRVVAQMAKDPPSLVSTPRPELTLRQQQLLALVAKGLTNKEIASRLNLSEFTVRNHIHRILKQVDAENRSQAVETIRSYGYSIGV
jgi:DNA-binding NarL/FixJ family response regulator